MTQAIEKLVQNANGSDERLDEILFLVKHDDIVGLEDAKQIISDLLAITKRREREWEMLLDQRDRAEQAAEDAKSDLASQANDHAALAEIREAAEEKLGVYTARRDSPLLFAQDLSRLLRAFPA